MGQGNREERNLRGVFPFRQGNRGNTRQQHRSPNRFRNEPPRDSRQRGRGSEEVALDIGSIAAAGERCIDKVVMVEETEYDDLVSCKHSYSEKCHTTYTTDFQPQQEEDCEETFTKTCFIEYRKQASTDTVKFCHTPILLEGGGPEECKTVYESSCTTRYEQHDVTDDVVQCETIQEEKCEDVTQGYTTEQKCTKWPVTKCSKDTQPVKKYSPVTKCEALPFERCGPGSQQVPGQEECFDRLETVVIEVNGIIIYIVIIQLTSYYNQT